MENKNGFLPSLYINQKESIRLMKGSGVECRLGSEYRFALKNIQKNHEEYS